MRIEEFRQNITDFFYPEQAISRKEREARSKEGVVNNLELMINITSQIDDVRTLYALQRTCKRMYCFSNSFFKELMKYEHPEAYKIISLIPPIKWNNIYKNYRLIDPKIHEKIRDNHKQFLKAAIGVFAISTVALGVAGASLAATAISDFKAAKIQEYMRVNGWDHQQALDHYLDVWTGHDADYRVIDVFGDPNSTLSVAPGVLGIIGTVSSVGIGAAITMVSGIYYIEEEYNP